MTGELATEQGKDDLCTPFWITDAIAEAGPIILDPCGNAWSTVPADVTWTHPEHDGLAEPWRRDVPGIVFVNPPYGRGHLRKWVRKAVDEAQLPCRCVALLMPADPSTRAYQIARDAAVAAVTFGQRIRFHGPRSNGPGTFASVLFLLGDRRLSVRAAAEFIETQDVRWCR